MNEIGSGIGKNPPEPRNDTEIENIEDRLRSLLENSDYVLTRIERACNRLDSEPKTKPEEDVSQEMNETDGVLHRLNRKIDTTEKNLEVAQEQLCRLEQLV